jgi:hypothetical protein
MSYHVALSRRAHGDIVDIVQVDGSPNTVAASLHRGVRSPRTVACSLRMTSRSTSNYRHLVASMSCMYLIPVIRCV